MAARAIRLLVRIYQYTLGTVLPNSCRYHPTCSEYTIQAVEKHGPGRGLLLAAKRILRCHPWGGFGHDPVPDWDTAGHPAERERY
jgi:putative membrane protein insertion efficiency factor